VRTSSSRSRVLPLLLLAVATSVVAPSSSAAEADLSITARAWLSTTISMPPASALITPRMVQTSPQHETELVAATQPMALTAAAAAVPRVYPESVILRALRHGDSAFGYCWRRADRVDSMTPPRKARLHLEVDSSGIVRAAHAGLGDELALGALAGDSLPDCLAKVGRRLPFPALGEPVKLSLLLLR
jgi:hypothetical protein